MARVTIKAILAAAAIDGLELTKTDEGYEFTNGDETYIVDVPTLASLSLEQWIAEAQNVAAEADEDEEDRPNSVVKSAYKAKYRERAANMNRKPKDIPAKALKRSTSDWLAIELARRTLDDKAKLVVPAFEAILDANGVKHDHWNRTTPGWQGRLRMTGRLALQRIVAEHDGHLNLPDGSTIVAPKSWTAKHVH